MQICDERKAVQLLVVEDDEGIRELIDVMFRRWSVMIDHACDGKAALERLRKRAYDAVVLDLMLPSVNGFEVIRELKNRNPELLPRTIVLTAASDLTLRDFADARLVRRIIRKPFDVGEFMDEVLSCARQRSEAS
jgi:DNA-binding response OmpR family regulator